MMANPLAPFWGGKDHEHLSEEEKRMIGCTPELRIPHEVRQIMIRLDDEMTAREMTQMFTGGGRV